MTLSATDPEERAAASRRRTTSTPSPARWDPNTLEVATGDVVRWNFPEATAGAPHDVWVIEPGEAPDSAGTEVSDDVVCPARRRSPHTLDEVGTWTFVCKLHSHVESGRWTGMVGTAEVGRGVDSRARASTSPSTG